MDSDSKFLIFIACILVGIVCSAVGGCAVTTWSGHAHEERMAALGYEEVIELVPGAEHPIRYWRKKD